jgi:putative ABC transport system permease protein
VATARAFVSHTIQREFRGRPLRIVVQGLAWPRDDGRTLPLIAGRAIRQAHYEMLADRSLGLRLGDRIPLGKDVYTVVGIATGMVGQSGDGIAFFTVSDAIAIQYDTPGEAIRLERQTRRSRLLKQDLGNTQPIMLERAAGPASELPALGTQNVSAIMVNISPGTDPAQVARVLSGWSDVTVYTNDAQRDLLLKAIERNRRQIGMFRTLLVIISAIIMALILYTLTLDKIHDIAMLKLMGARNRVIVALILQQALLLGAMGYGLAYGIGLWVFPFFPRRVAVTQANLVQLGVVVLAISILSSFLGIWKAMSIQPNEILS